MEVAVIARLQGHREGEFVEAVLAVDLPEPLRAVDTLSEDTRLIESFCYTSDTNNWCPDKSEIFRLIEAALVA